MFRPNLDLSAVAAFLGERFGPVTDLAPLRAGGREFVARFGHHA